MVIYVPVKFEFDWTKHFWVRVRKWNVDRQTDVGHINLTGGLVTRNPPKNSFPPKHKIQHPTPDSNKTRPYTEKGLRDAEIAVSYLVFQKESRGKLS